MKNLSFRILLFMGVILTLFASCEYDFNVYPQPVLPPVGTEDTISFAQDIIPIFTEKCVSCHKPGAFAPDLSAANAFSALTSDNYVVAKKPDESILYTCLKAGGSMNQYSTVAETALIYRWIYAGAKNN
ncbi:MAG TPA: hypothetical protein PK796_04260 [Bacteroidales bacterium]|jgi:hypothetical protein|nr:hypothetical protein [Bacteroidales bacterium]